MFIRRPPLNRSIALAPAMFLICAASLLLAHSGRADDKKPAAPKVAVHCGGAAEDLKVLREMLAKVPGIKFKADEIKFADFGRDGGLFTSLFTIEIADLAKTDIGALAKIVASADTSKREKNPPALFVVIRCKPDSTNNEQLRAALAKVKGVPPEKSWAGDVNLWISVDSNGEGKLAEITKSLHDAGIKIRDPITDTSDQP